MRKKSTQSKERENYTARTHLQVDHAQGRLHTRHSEMGSIQPPTSAPTALVMQGCVEPLFTFRTTVVKGIQNDRPDYYSRL